MPQLPRGFLSEARELGGKWDAAFSTADFARELDAQDWSQSINLFRQLAARWAGFPAFATPRANPLRWAIASDSYSRLAIENEELFRARPLYYLDLLLKEGEQIDRDLSLEFIPRNPDKFVDLLAKLLDEYAAALNEIEAEAHKVMKRSLVDYR